jgi:Cu+-exporting ATPase
MLAVMEVSPQERTALTRDPVCGMTVEPTTASHMEHNGSTYYFCSDGCRAEFEKRPDRYAEPVGSGGAHEH